jgi:hypothetical protein
MVVVVLSVVVVMLLSVVVVVVTMAALSDRRPTTVLRTMVMSVQTLTRVASLIGEIVVEGALPMRTMWLLVRVVSVTMILLEK